VTSAEFVLKRSRKKNQKNKNHLKIRSFGLQLGTSDNYNKDAGMSCRVSEAISRAQLEVTLAVCTRACETLVALQRGGLGRGGAGAWSGGGIQ